MPWTEVEERRVRALWSRDGGMKARALATLDAARREIAWLEAKHRRALDEANNAITRLTAERDEARRLQEELDADLEAAEAQVAALDAKVKHHEAIVATLVEWIEKKHPADFREGLWEALAAVPQEAQGRGPETEPNSGGNDV